MLQLRNLRTFFAGWRITGIVVIAGTLATAWSCAQGPVDPDSLSQSVLVGGGAQGRFYVVDGQAGRIASISASAFVFRYPDQVVRSPDGDVLYITSAAPVASKQLVAFDTRTLAARWQEPLPDVAARSPTGNLLIWGTYSLAVSPDGTKLLLDGRRNDTLGLAVVDLSTRSPVGLLARFGSYDPATLPPSADLPAGAVLIAGTHEATADQHDSYLFLLDGQTLEPRDSIWVSRTAGEGGGLASPLLAPDGRSVYTATSDSIYKIDLVSRRVAASAPRPVPYAGGWALAPDGQTLYWTDPGDGRDFPGTGLVFTFGPDLELRDPIDLNGASVNGVSPVLRSVALSRDGSLIYVLTGTPSAGPLFGVQPARLLIVDAATKALVHAVPLPGDWAVRAIFPY